MLAWVASVVGVLLVVAVIAGFVIHVPYVIISPGDSTPLDRSVVSIDGATTYPHRTPVEFLTVRVSNEDPTFWRYLLATLDSDRDVEKRESVVGCLSDRDNQQFNTDLMSQSQNDARYVALTRLGYQVEASDARLTVIQACKGVPAYGKLHVGDQVVAVDGTPVTTLTEVGSRGAVARGRFRRHVHRRAQRRARRRDRHHRQGLEGPHHLRPGREPRPFVGTRPTQMDRRAAARPEGRRRAAARPRKASPASGS